MQRINNLIYAVNINSLIRKYGKINNFYKKIQEELQL